MSVPALNRTWVLVAALLFSTGGTVVKAITLSSWQVASFRSGTAALALMLIMPGWRRWWQPRTLLVGAAYATTMILYVSGNKLTTAANTIFLQSTAPMYLLILGPLVLRERARRSDLLFSAVLAAGIVMFFVGIEAPRVTAPDPMRGNILGALCGVSWALTILGLRWLGTKKPDAGDDAGAAVVAGNVLACLVALPFALPVVVSVPLDWALVAYLGVVQIGLAYVCMTRAVRHVPAFEVSLLLLLEPVASALLAWLIHDEQPGPWSLAGCSVILLATVVRTLRRGG